MLQNMRKMFSAMLPCCAIFLVQLGCTTVSDSREKVPPEVRLAKDVVLREYGWRKAMVLGAHKLEDGTWKMTVVRLPTRPGSFAMVTVSNMHVIRIDSGW